MKKGTKKFTGSMAALATVASIVAPTAAALAAETTAEEMVTWAEKTKNFYDFNMALKKVTLMPEKNTEYYGLLARLANIEKDVKTADIAAVLDSMVSFGDNRDLTNFYDVYDLVNQVKDEKARLYLQSELNTWGHDSVFTSDVVAATDAILKAWNSQDPSDVDAALDAIANVKLAGNISWLNDQIGQVRNTVKMRVQNVSAINSSELQVKFTRNVNPASVRSVVTRGNGQIDLVNFVITLNNERYGVGYEHATSEIINLYADDLADVIDVDGNVVTLKLFQNPAANGSNTLNFGMRNGDKYSVDVKDGVLTKDLSTKVERFGDVQHVFTDYTAPKLLSAELNSSNHLELAFDEPVAAYLFEKDFPEGLVQATIDGIPFNFYRTSLNVLDYTLTSYNVAPTSVGVHEVVIYNVRDEVSNNGNEGNKAAILSTKYEVKAGQIPSVKKVEADDFNTLKLTFSEPVKKGYVVVKKGNTKFFEGLVNEDAYSDEAYIDLPSKAIANADDNTNLYDSDENEITVSVNITAYKDTDKLIGNEYNTKVTLARDTDTPNLKGQYYNKINEVPNTTVGQLLLPFDRTGLISLWKPSDGLVDPYKVVVKDKNGVVRTADVQITSTSLTENKKDALSIKIYKDVKGAGFLTKTELEKLAPFTVQVAASAVKINTDFFSPLNFITTLKNPAETTKVYADDSYEYKAKESVQYVTINQHNVILVTYKESMSASAADLSNYTLDGKVMPTGTTIDMSGDNKIVRITLPEETYASDVWKKLVISKEVTTTTGAYLVGDIATKEQYSSQLLNIKDNVKPTVAKAEYIVLDAANPTPTRFIKVTFSEKVYHADDKNDFVVTVNGVDQEVAEVYDSFDGDKVVTIVLKHKVNPQQVATVKVASTTDIEDLAVPANIAAVGSNVKTTGNIQFYAPADVPSDWKDLDAQLN